MVVALIGLPSCAARGVGGQKPTIVQVAQDSAQVVGEGVLFIDQTDRTLFTQKVYDQAMHDKLGIAVIRLLYAGRGYERAVAAAPGVTTSVTAAGAGVVSALSDFEQMLPAAARPAVAATISAIRGAIAGGVK